MAAYGATSSLPDALAKVPSQFRFADLSWLPWNIFTVREYSPLIRPVEHITAGILTLGMLNALLDSLEVGGGRSLQ
jgi:hypothetical protein